MAPLYARQTPKRPPADLPSPFVACRYPAYHRCRHRSRVPSCDLLKCDAINAISQTFDTFHLVNRKIPLRGLPVMQARGVQPGYYLRTPHPDVLASIETANLSYNACERNCTNVFVSRVDDARKNTLSALFPSRPSHCPWVPHNRIHAVCLPSTAPRPTKAHGSLSTSSACTFRFFPWLPWTNETVCSTRRLAVMSNSTLSRCV